MWPNKGIFQKHIETNKSEDQRPSPRSDGVILCEIGYNEELLVFDGFLRKQFLHFLVNTQTRQRRLYDPIEYKSRVNQHSKADDLEKLECLPTKTQRDNPDEERSAGINS